MFSPSDAKEPESGDLIVVLVGDYDPPTMAYYRAIEALFKRPEVNHVWVSPSRSKIASFSWEMASILALDFAVNKKQIGQCLLNDKSPNEIISWLRNNKRYSDKKFRLASVDDPLADSEITYCIKLGIKGDTSPEGVELITLEEYAPIPMDFKERIKAGSDESRIFIPAIWSFIQKNKLYRGDANANMG